MDSTYILLQHYWWFLVSLLGALLVFLLFVQGGQSLLFTIGKTELQQKMLLNSTGRKWEFTFTTLVTFGGAFFASFPLFYSTSFGGAYWVWMLILACFVLQAVSYEYQSKKGNLLGKKTYQVFLLLNGILGPILLGTAVGTFFSGAEFVVNKGQLTDVAMPVISTWATPWHGLEAAFVFWNVCLGLAVFFLARIQALLYFINNIDDAEIVKRSRKHLLIETVLFLVLTRKQNLQVTLKEQRKKSLRLLAGCICVPLLALGGIIAYYGGYKKTYEALLTDYQTCGTPIYTIFGSLYYEHVQDKIEYTPQIKKEIEDWLSKHPRRQPLPFQIEARDNCIIILAESFESWVLEKSVEGKEITPNLNRMLKEENVLYAPYVQTQVKGSRSIDGQLLLHTGLLPINYGAYSARFPHHTYYSIDKAFKEKYEGGGTCCMTVDKKVVWNVAIVAQDFGYDKLLDKPYFVLDEKTGPRHRLGDVSFLRQCGEKLATEELFPTGGHTLVQCVTYSGHSPFIIPEESKRISFSDKLPERLRNYMVVANYTDYAIGQFITFLRSQKKFENTMIVITGDHEGFGLTRKPLYEHALGKDIISPERFTPLIVLNSPVHLRYEKVMGQVDLYPTLLDLLGADDYPWRGLGESILSSGKKAFAISPQMEIIGDTVGVSTAEIQHAKDAWRVSDLIISCDYFAHGRTGDKK